MARNLIASRLIKSVRDRAMIPDDVTVYDDDAILDILNEEIDVGLLDTLLELHEEHLVSYVDVSASETRIENNTRRLVIPHRAVGNKLRAIKYRQGGTFYDLNRIDLSEVSDFSMEGGSFSTSGRDLFYVEGDEIVVISPFATEGSLFRIYYHLRPSTITMETKCAKIVSIDRETGVIVFETLAKDTFNAETLDFVQNRSPNRILGTEITKTSASLSLNTMTINPVSIPDRLRDGDWVCPAEYSPYPNVPTELHPVLAQRAAVYILEAMGDTENLNSARGKLKQMEKSVQKILDDRVEASPRKIKNRYGTLRGRTVLNDASRGRL